MKARQFRDRRGPSERPAAALCRSRAPLASSATRRAAQSRSLHRRRHQHVPDRLRRQPRARGARPRRGRRRAPSGARRSRGPHTGAGGDREPCAPGSLAARAPAGGAFRRSVARIRSARRLSSRSHARRRRGDPDRRRRAPLASHARPFERPPLFPAGERARALLGRPRDGLVDFGDRAARREPSAVPGLRSIACSSSTRSSRSPCSTRDTDLRSKSPGLA